MKVLRLIILAMMIVAGNIVCRISLSYDNLSTPKEDEKYHVFERAIDDVGIIVEDVVPVSIGSVSSTRQNTTQGRYNLATYKSIDRYYSNIKSKIFRYSLKTASHPRTLYFIFALHRMRD